MIFLGRPYYFKIQARASTRKTTLLFSLPLSEQKGRHNCVSCHLVFIFKLLVLVWYLAKGGAKEWSPCPFESPFVYLNLSKEIFCLVLASWMWQKKTATTRVQSRCLYHCIPWRPFFFLPLIRSQLYSCKFTELNKKLIYKPQISGSVDQIISLPFGVS